MKSTARPADPFGSPRPRAAETVRSRETTSEDLRRAATPAARPVRMAAPETPSRAEEVYAKMKDSARAAQEVRVEQQREAFAPKRKQVLDAARKDLPVPDAARAAGVPESTARKWVKDAGIAAPKGKPGPKPPAAKVTAKEIAAAMNALPPGTADAAADLGVKLPPEVAAFGEAFEAPAQRGPLKAPTKPPMFVSRSAVCRNCGDDFDGPERACPNPSPGEPYVDCGRGGHWFEDPPAPPTGRGDQLPSPAPQHTEIYVGPPRGAEIGRYREAMQKALGLLASYRSSWPTADEVGMVLSRVLAGGAP